MTWASVSRFCLWLLIANALNGVPAYAQVSSEENPQSVAKASPSPAKSSTPKPKASPKKKKSKAKKTPTPSKKKKKASPSPSPKKKTKASASPTPEPKKSPSPRFRQWRNRRHRSRPQRPLPRRSSQLGQRLGVAPFHRWKLRSQDLLAIRVTNRRRARLRAAAGGSGLVRKSVIVIFRGQFGAKSIGPR